MKTSLHMVVATMLILAAANANAAAEVEDICSALGMADRAGGGWSQFTIATPSDFFPVILRFSTRSPSPSSLLGHGWAFPLFESCVYLEDEGRILVNLPDGKRKYLYQTPGSENSTFTSRDYAWKAELDGKKLSVRHEKWSYVFQNGLLTSMVMPNGRRYEWKRTNNSIVIMTPGGEQLGTCGLETTNGTQLAKAFTLAGTKYQLGFDQIPKTTKVTGDSVLILGLTTSATHVLADKKPLIQLHHKSDDEFATINTTIWSLAQGSEVSREIRWSADSGELLGEQNATYSFTYSDADGLADRIMKRYNDGTFEEMKWDRPSGTWDAVFRNGDKEHVAFICTPGPSFEMLRKAVRTPVNQGAEEIYRAFYDSTGAKLRVCAKTQWGNLTTKFKGTKIASYGVQVTQEGYSLQSDPDVEIVLCQGVPILKFWKNGERTDENIGGGYWRTNNPASPSSSVYFQKEMNSGSEVTLSNLLNVNKKAQ